MPRKNYQCQCCQCVSDWQSTTISTSGSHFFESRGDANCTFELAMAFPAPAGVLTNATYDVIWGCDPDDHTEGGVRLRVVRTISAVAGTDRSSSVFAGTREAPYQCEWRLELSRNDGTVIEQATLVGFPGIAGWPVQTTSKIRVAMKSVGTDGGVSIAAFMLAGSDPFNVFANAQSIYTEAETIDQLETANHLAPPNYTPFAPGLAHYFATLEAIDDEGGRAVASTAPVNASFTPRRAGQASLATFPDPVTLDCTDEDYEEPDVPHVQENACGRTIAVGHFPYGKEDTDYTGLQVSFYGTDEILEGAYELSNQSENGDPLAQGTFWFSGEFDRPGSFGVGADYYSLRRIEIFASVRPRRGEPCLQEHGGTDWGVSIWTAVRVQLEARNGPGAIPRPYAGAMSLYMGLVWKAANTAANPAAALFSGRRADDFLLGDEVFASRGENGNYAPVAGGSLTYSLIARNDWATTGNVFTPDGLTFIPREFPNVRTGLTHMGFQLVE
jgi:hypothetical protein